MPTNTADIRQYLTSSYSDEELTTLCYDYFRDVYDNFAARHDQDGRRSSSCSITASVAS